MNIFDAEVISRFFSLHYFLFVVGIFLFCFLATWYLIPKIIWVINEKKLTKPVIERSVHVKPIPTLGGVAFFTVIVLTLSLLQVMKLGYTGNHLIAAVTLLFMVGVKDDLIISTARVKLLGQFLAISFLVFSPELQISTLHGFFGIHEIPFWTGYVLAAFLLLAVINSYNLIDGIDGLAAVIGILIGTIYAVVFYYSGEHFYVLVSIMLVGILSAFLRFNFSQGARKIFMGDSGALVIGMLIGFLSLKILNLDAPDLMINNFIPENRLLFVLAVLYIPFFDTTRSMLIRLLHKKSPFAPDRNHIHHVLLDSGRNHIQATLLLGLLNSFAVAVFLILASIFESAMMSLAMLIFFASSCLLFRWIKQNRRAVAS